MNVEDGVHVLPDGRMDAANTARYCGLAQKTLAQKRCDGTGPTFVKLGRIFYFRSDVDAWLQKARASSTANTRQHSIISLSERLDSGAIPSDAGDCPEHYCAGDNDLSTAKGGD